MVVLQLCWADYRSQLLCLYKQQMFCIYELVSKHTGMAAFTDFSLTSSITVKRKQIFRICSDWKQNVFLAAWPAYAPVCSLLLISGWPLKNYTKLGDNESFPRDQECAICLITLYDKLARLNNVVSAKHKCWFYLSFSYVQHKNPILSIKLYSMSC